ncbi:hypothetical protein PENNAL_c0079G11318 [Penicillium nalgiovense]|uniref:Cytochrome P450 n=1 Tax=Penicillium nalgiovense TaxID=60175 RepID=A0A1V6XHM6_PENNA|nr:hypothetical protein PENNAL_c0079G11318 [Penicillium nalgiovense]
MVVKLVLDSFLLAHLEVVVGVLGLALLRKLAFNRYGYGIAHIPGPFLASITDFWRLFVVWGRRPEIEHIRLHKQYGKFVRLGPNTVSVSDPSSIREIYGLAAGFKKSDFYIVQQTLAKGRPLSTLFTSTDEKFHAKLRRAVHGAYAMSTLVQFEPYVDSTIRALIRQIEIKFADKQEICNFGQWLQYYAFDVIGELTYSKRLGFIDNGIDVDGIISSIEWMLDYASVVGQIPLIDKLLLKNPIRLFLSTLGLIGSTTPMVTFAWQRFSERVDLATGIEKLSTESEVSSTRRDFLSRFLEAHRKDPDFISNDRVLALSVANIFAGSDTTAISLRSVFYFLLKHPEELQRLREELDQQKQTGKFKRTDGLVDWEEVRELPVLNAVIKEALRMHPAAGLTLERIAPPQGIQVCGKFIPGGTTIGCSAWTIHQDTTIFGLDPDRFRPLRWLEASQEQRRLMEKYLFTFGAGSRTCIGKNISLLEMYKLIPALLMRFQLELPGSDSEWKLHNAWFVKQTEFYVRFQSRGPS